MSVVVKKCATTPIGGLMSSDGFLDIQSDYGSFSYAWSSFGDNFKKFLIDCDRSYIICKIGRNYPPVYNASETERAIRSEILRMRKSHELDRQNARDAWNELDMVDLSLLDMFDLSFEGDLFRDLPKVFEYVYGNDPSAVPVVKETDYSVTAFMSLTRGNHRPRPLYSFLFFN